MNPSFSKVGVQLNLRGHQDDANSTGIISVDGTPTPLISSWPLADGIIHSTGDGTILIRNPRMNQQIVLDFSDPTHPCHRPSSTGPCTQD